MPTIKDRFQHAWNAFVNNRDPTYSYQDVGMTYSYKPDRPRFTKGNERSIVTAVYNRIAMDAAAIDVEHVRVDEDGRYLRTLNTSLNDCLTVEANVDQTGRGLIQDIVMSMLDEGYVAVVPTVASKNPRNTDSYNIYALRTGKILKWAPRHVTVRLYDDRTGRHEDLTLPKRIVAIVENPMYAVVNETNSTMQRLIRKLNLLDYIDEQSGSGKLDLIVQLPYVIKTDQRREQAEKRRKDIEDQLRGPYGIAYTDGTERITQLNRPVENNLLKQIESLTSMLYSQLGLTQEIMAGTADEKTMNNYYVRTIEPILSAIVDEMKRKFLSRTARSQGQSIDFFRDPFKLIPLTEIANVADAFGRNEITSSNEIRQGMGMRPSQDPKADELHNSNMPYPEEDPMMDPAPEEAEEESMMDPAPEELDSSEDTGYYVDENGLVKPKTY